jgi:hypothetical protein
MGILDTIAWACVDRAPLYLLIISIMWTGTLGSAGWAVWRFILKLDNREI